MPFALFSQEEATFISIYSSPSKIQIRLNSVILGTTPMERISIKPGSHLIEAVANNPGIWNHTNVIKRFNIYAGQDTTIFIQFTRGVKINSLPFNAKLISDKGLLGSTPLTIPFEENLGKEFHLEKPGYKTYTFLLEDPQSKLFTMQKIELKSSSDESQSFTHSLFRTRTKSKFLFLTGTVAAHWLAFYFKNLADDNFEKYLTTGNPNLMSKYWNNTQKFDRYSNISLGISYAFLGGLIYTVLWR
jgi:hypothetical protein